MTRIRCRTVAQAHELQLVLDTQYPDALTTRTGRVVRSELSADVIARATGRDM